MNFDFNARMAVSQDRNNLESVLPTIRVPTLLIVAEFDNICHLASKCCRQIPNGELITIPGINHFEGFGRSHLIVRNIKQFLRVIDNQVKIDKLPRNSGPPFGWVPQYLLKASTTL